MPTVPYNPVAGASPSGQGTPYFTDRGATEQAFGAGIGQSMEKFGTQLERTADVVQTHVLQAQAFINEADVNAAVTADIQSSGERNNKFRMLPGNQAQEALEGHVKGLQADREALRDSLKNPMAKKMFDQQTMHRFALDTVNSSQYAATQAKQYLKQSLADRSDTVIQDIASKANDPTAVARGVEELKSIERQKGKIDDENPDAINKNIRTQLTKATAALTSSLSKNHPEDAQKILDTAKKEGVVDATQVEMMQNKIDVNAIQLWAQQDASKIAQDNIQADPTNFTRNPEGTFNKMREAAAKAAEERYPNDPANRGRYLIQLESNLTGKVNLAKKAEADRTTDLKAISMEVANKEMPGTGRKPISIQEMNTLNPQSQEYVNEAQKRDPTFLDRLNTKLRNNAKEDIILPQSQLDDQWKIFKGKDDAQKMLADPSKDFERGLINQDLKNRMELEQANIKKISLSKFNVNGIMSQHQAALNDLGIFASKTDMTANTKYQWFRGALESELQRIQGTSNVQVSGPKATEVVNGLLKDVATGKRSWFGLGSGVEKPKYEVMSADQPDWIKKSEFKDAVKNPSNGKWYVWREGKPKYVEEQK